MTRLSPVIVDLGVSAAEMRDRRRMCRLGTAWRPVGNQRREA